MRVCTKGMISNLCYDLATYLGRAGKNYLFLKPIFKTYKTCVTCICCGNIGLSVLENQISRDHSMEKAHSISKFGNSMDACNCQSKTVLVPFWAIYLISLECQILETVHE